MRPYVAVFRARFLALLQYRAAALAGFGTQVFWGFIRVMIFAAFYALDDGAPAHASRRSSPTSGSARRRCAGASGGRPGDRGGWCAAGNVAYELLRPVDLYWFWFARARGPRRADAPPGAAAARPARCSSSGCRRPPPGPRSPRGRRWHPPDALLLSSAIATVLDDLAAVDGLGPRHRHPRDDRRLGLLGHHAALCRSSRTGRSRCSKFLPFRGLMDTPFRLYLGHIPPSAIVPALAHQLLWSRRLRPARPLAARPRDAGASWCREADDESTVRLYFRYVGISIREPRCSTAPRPSCSPRPVPAHGHRVPRRCGRSSTASASCRAGQPGGGRLLYGMVNVVLRARRGRRPGLRRLRRLRQERRVRPAPAAARGARPSRWPRASSS